MKPKPKFEGEILVWRRDLMVETKFEYETETSCIGELSCKRLEERFRAERFCEGGELHWVKINANKLKKLESGLVFEKDNK